MDTDSKQIIQTIDFWHKTVVQDKILDREIVGKMNLKNKEITDLIGSRRSGKSFVLKLIIKSLGLTDDFLFINFEDPFFINNNQPEIIGEFISVFKEYYSSNLKYLFFDEIQNINKWEKAVNKLRESGQYKIFVTGSSAKLLSREMATLLTGRHISYNILPLSFAEFLNFRGLKLDRKKDLVLEDNKIKKYFDEYVALGGFPEVVLSESKELLKNLFFDILQKDIVMRYEIRDKDTLEKMAVYLMSNSARIVSLESIKRVFNISFNQVSAYLDYYKEAFMFFELCRFNYSLKKQYRALKKIYAVDTGLSKAVSFRFSGEQGWDLENIVFLELKRRGREIFYYKTANNLEVDFLVRENNTPIELIQVCWGLGDAKTKNRELGGLVKAMDELKLKNSLVLTNNQEDVIADSGKTIVVKPVYNWLLDF